MAKNHPDYFTLMFACARVGAVLVPLNWRLAPPELAYVLNDAEVTILVIDPAMIDCVTTVLDDLPRLNLMVPLGADIVVDNGHTREPFESWLRAAATPRRAPLSQPRGLDVCLQFYTSGTTGHPKGVMLTNTNLLHNMPEVAESWRVDAGSVTLVSAPTFHIGGTTWALIAMFTGGTTVLLREVITAEILRTIDAKHITAAMFPSGILQLMLEAPDIAGYDLSSLQTIIYGASPISETTLAMAMQLFTAGFLHNYGLTEATGAVVQLEAYDHDPVHRPALLRSCGKPRAGVELRIVEPDSFADVDDGVVGEVVIRSRQNMKGYWKRPTDTIRALTLDGWLRTGDLGYLEDGYLYPVRPAQRHDHLGLGERLPRRGRKRRHEASGSGRRRGDRSSRRAVGRGGEGGGGARGRPPDPADLIAFTRSLLAHYKCPRQVEFVEALPRNAAGKVLKTKLRQPYSASDTPAATASRSNN